MSPSGYSFISFVFLQELISSLLYAVTKRPPLRLVQEPGWFNIGPAPVIGVGTEPKLLLELTFIED